jgi:ribosomal protein S15P/S13E
MKNTFLLLIFTALVGNVQAVDSIVEDIVDKLRDDQVLSEEEKKSRNDIIGRFIQDGYTALNEKECKLPPVMVGYLARYLNKKQAHLEGTKKYVCVADHDQAQKAVNIAQKDLNIFKLFVSLHKNQAHAKVVKEKIKNLDPVKDHRELDDAIVELREARGDANTARNALRKNYGQASSQDVQAVDSGNVVMMPPYETDGIVLPVMEFDSEDPEYEEELCCEDYCNALLYEKEEVKSMLINSHGKDQKSEEDLKTLKKRINSVVEYMRRFQAQSENVMGFGGNELDDAVEKRLDLEESYKPSVRLFWLGRESLMRHCVEELNEHIETMLQQMASQPGIQDLPEPHKKQLGLLHIIKRTGLLPTHNDDYLKGTLLKAVDEYGESLEINRVLKRGIQQMSIFSS